MAQFGSPRTIDHVSEWRPGRLQGSDPSSELGAVVVLAGLFMILIAGFVSPGLGAVVSVVALVGGAVLLSRRRRRTRAIEDTAEILDASFIGFCTVVYSFRGVSYGADDGSLSVADGFLHFRGVRTEFSLGRGRFEAVELGYGNFSLTFADHFRVWVAVDTASIGEDDDLDFDDEAPRPCPDLFGPIKALALEDPILSETQLFPPMTSNPPRRFKSNLAIMVGCGTVIALSAGLFYTPLLATAVLPWIVYAAMVRDFRVRGSRRIDR